MVHNGKEDRQDEPFLLQGITHSSPQPRVRGGVRVGGGVARQWKAGINVDVSGYGTDADVEKLRAFIEQRLSAALHYDVPVRVVWIVVEADGSGGGLDLGGSDG